MRPSLKTALLACLLATVGAHTTSAQKSGDAKSAASPENENPSGKINIAIPLHQPVKGIHLPFYDLGGKLKMQFDAETANRTSENVIEMTALKVETFDDNGKREMLVDFPTANYDLTNSQIESKDRVEVRRADFVLTGVGMKFDTKKRNGRFFSQIRMEILDRSHELPTSTPASNGP